MIQKHILVLDRVHRPPANGWSWIDRRFLREHAPRLSHEAILLYFFLAAVSDKDGLSFYGDATIALHLRMAEAVVVRAPDELVAADLVAYRRRSRRCSPCPPPRSSAAAAAWLSLARSCAAWPAHPLKPIRGGHHEGFSLGGDPPFARSGALVSGGNRPSSPLFPPHVRKALSMASPPVPKPGPRGGILDRYRPQIDALLAKYPGLSAVRVKEEISRGEEGYRGTVYPVRRYLCRVRPSRGRVYQEVFYEPGEALQVDWGDCGRLVIGQTVRRVSVFVAVLCYSRMCYIEFDLSQRKADFYRGVVHALEFFQGSPRKLIVDNLKAAVLNGSGRHACFHPDFLALCGHFYLEPIACAARDPESKGIVEGGVRYVKGGPWRAAARS